MKKIKFPLLFCVCLFASAIFFVAGYYYGDSRGYSRGRMDEHLATFHVQLYVYLQLYDMRRHIEFPNEPPKWGMRLNDTRLFVTSALAFYERHKEEYDQSKWTGSPWQFEHMIERSRVIYEEAMQEWRMQTGNSRNDPTDDSGSNPTEEVREESE